MSNWEKYSRHIHCDNCKLSGQAKIKETENPIFNKGKVDRLVDGIEGPFSVKNSIISCDQCGAIVLDVEEI